MVLLLSAATIAGCWYAQKRLLPESQRAYLSVDITYTDGTSDSLQQMINYDKQSPLALLEADGQEKKEIQDTKYAVERIENSVKNLSSKRKTAYYTLTGMMVILPMLYSIIGVSFCAWLFYKKKLDQPLKILSKAAENIRNYDLDFRINYDSRDEMGELAAAFEQMRIDLYKNNQKLWKMVRDEKELQASLAHDLRNPIAVLKGYAEYLQQCINNGNLEVEKVRDVSGNLIEAALRMERYTDSIKLFHNIEELNICKDDVRLPDYLQDMAEDFEVVAVKHKKEFETVIPETEMEIAIDMGVFSRIMENVFMNAIRFAQKRIEMKCALQDNVLMVCISDDGEGFAEKVLQKVEEEQTVNRKYQFDLSDGHMGMGLAIGKILAGKHGGDMKLENTISGGAKVTVTINIEKK